jgi:hypothetical protein
MTAPSSSTNQYATIVITTATSTATATATTSTTSTFSQIETTTYTQTFLNSEGQPVFEFDDSNETGVACVFDFNIDASQCNPTDWILVGIGDYADPDAPSSNHQVQISGYTPNTGVWAACVPTVQIPVGTSTDPDFLLFAESAAFGNQNLSGITFTDQTSSQGNISFYFKYYSKTLDVTITFDPPLTNDQ